MKKILIGFTLGAGMLVYASTWQGVSEIKSGMVISAETLSDNFVYLYNRSWKGGDGDNFIAFQGANGVGAEKYCNVTGDVCMGSNQIVPPTCIGENKALNWDGIKWICNNLGSVTPAKVLSNMRSTDLTIAGPNITYSGTKPGFAYVSVTRQGSVPGRIFSTNPVIVSLSNGDVISSSSTYTESSIDNFYRHKITLNGTELAYADIANPRLNDKHPNRTNTDSYTLGSNSSVPPITKTYTSTRDSNGWIVEIKFMQEK